MPQPAPAQQLDALKAQADYFQDALEQIRARIQDLESDSNQG
jgi:prefoldin subunit 5